MYVCMYVCVCVNTYTYIYIEGTHMRHIYKAHTKGTHTHTKGTHTHKAHIRHTHKAHT